MNTKFKQFFLKLKDSEAWDIYALSMHELEKRNLVRTRNIVGERGEFLAIEYFNGTSGLSNLQAAPEGTQNVDALSKKGERYSIKTITEPGRTTGVFYGCGNLNDKNLPDQKFEYSLIVVIGKDFQLKHIYEFTWAQFLKNRRWHSTMKAWNLSLTRKLAGKLFELRIRGKREIRVIYTFKKKTIYLLHTFIKKSQKTPKKEIAIANERLDILSTLK